MSAITDAGDTNAAMVLRAIAAGTCRAKLIISETGLTYREVDHALQTLRKAGKIHYDGVWRVTGAS